MTELRPGPLWRGVRNLLWALARMLPSPGLWASAVLLAIVVRAAVLYADSLVPLILEVDGETRSLRTRCVTVGDVLDDARVEVAEWDRVAPTRDMAVQPGMRITVQHARAVTVVADGTTRTLYSHARGVESILEEAGLSYRSGDELWVNHARAVKAPGTGGEARLAMASPQGTVLASDPRLPVVHVEIRRASTIHVLDGGVEQTIRTTVRTLAQALQEAGIVLYLGDRVVPDLNASVQTGLRVRIERSMPVSVVVDGRKIRTRTHRETVGEVLAELGVSLVGRDFSSPTPDEPVWSGIEIKVSRVLDKQVIEQDQIPFETQWFPDSLLELDHRRVDAVGANGIRRRRYQVVSVDGVEVERTLEDEWVARDPQPQKIAYGTKIVVRTLDTPDGPIEYWRRVHVFLTSYTEATCGKTPDHPWYGLTRLGWKMRRGIVAVDPRVIALLSEVYVPGYGRGIAADTGGLIIGRHIDLGHDVDDFVMWFEWGYAYILTPVPPPDKIRWILPDFPRGRWP